MTLDTQSALTALEECVDELNDFCATLQRYAPAAIAIALRIQLGALLQALIDARECTPLSPWLSPRAVGKVNCSAWIGHM